MKTAITFAAALGLAGAAVTAFPPAAGQPQKAAPAPNPDSQYRLGPDSLPQEGVPKGEIRGPFTLPCQVYPGTQHTYWVYVPAQYDPAVPTALMVFQDGQAFKDERGDLRAQNVMDNLIYRREIPVMLGVFINPGRRPDQPEPTPRNWGDRDTNRPTEYNSLDDRYARVITEEQEAALRLHRAAAPEHEPAVALRRRIECDGLRGPQVRRAVHDEADRSVTAVLAEEDHAAGEVLVLELRHRDEQRRRERVAWVHARMVATASHLVKPRRGRSCTPRLQTVAIGRAARAAAARTSRAGTGRGLIVGFVHAQASTLQLRAVELLAGTLGIIGARHHDEREAA